MTNHDSQRILAAIKGEAEMPVGERWAKMVSLGVIDERGRVLIRCPDAEMNAEDELEREVEIEDEIGRLKSASPRRLS